MTQEDKDIVIAEIERLEVEIPYHENAWSVLNKLKVIINTLPTEQPSEDLEISIIEFLGHIPENEPEHSETLYTYEQMQEIARHFAQWQKEQSTKLLKTIYSDCDNLKKDLDRVTTGNLPHRIGNIKFSITGIQVIIKQVMEGEQ